MAKALRDILKKANDTINGVRPSTTTDGSTGKDPGVDYMPKAGDEQDFVAKHSVQKWDDPNGNGTDHFQASNIKYSLDKSSEKHYGYKKPEDKKVNESKKAEDAQCNRSPKGTKCPMHGMNECMSVRKITEKEVDEAYDDNSSNVSHWSDKKLKFHKEKMTSSSAKAHSELLRRSKTGDKGGIKEEVEDIEELSKATLGSYIKKAATDVATNSAATGRHAERSNKIADHQKKTGDYSKETQRRKDSQTADKAFDKSWKRRAGIAKATDKLTKEDVQIDELSTDTYHSAAHKAAKRAMGDAQGRSGPIFKKYAGMANKFRDKGMEQEKKEKAAKAMKEETIDEVSSNTLISYLDKVHKSPSNAGTSKSYSRDVKGVGLANDKLNPQRAALRGNKVKVPATEEVERVDEISNKLALSYAKGAEKSMNAAAAKGSTGHETFMKRSAGHKLALDKTNPEHKRLKAKVGTSNANAKDAAYKKAIGEEAIDEVLTKSTTAGETISDFVHSDNPKFAGKSKEKRKQMALAAYYAKQREQKEDFAQPLLGSNDDSSVSMVKAELKALANKAMDLVMQMPDSMHVEPWCQAKIAQAKAYVNDVHDYMVYGDHKDEEDEQMDTPMTFPNMSVDVNSGRNV